MTLHIGTWYWGKKYPRFYVDRLQSAIARNLSGEYRFHVWEPLEQDKHLTQIPGCFARMRAFDPEWQRAQGIKENERLVNLDLDLLVVGHLGGLFDRTEPFTILKGVNASNPCPYNGSVWSLKAGHRPDVWFDFSFEKASTVPFYAFPDDQAWFHYMMPDAGPHGPLIDGVYAFRKVGWTTGAKLPSSARIVAFPGHRDPAKFHHLRWVRENWR